MIFWCFIVSLFEKVLIPEKDKISVTLDKQNDIEINYNFCMYQINIGGIDKILSNRKETAKLVSLQILNYEIT